MFNNFSKFCIITHSLRRCSRWVAGMVSAPSSLTLDPPPHPTPLTWVLFSFRIFCDGFSNVNALEASFSLT